MESLLSLIKKKYVLLYLIFFLGFAFYMYILTAHRLIYGIDGPYYLIQVRSMLEGGFLEYGDPPFAFFIFSFFTLLFGGDITLGIRIGVALFSSLSAVPLYFWIKKVTGSELSGYIAMLACIFSAPHIRLMNDLLKNVVGSFFLLCFLYYLHSLAFEGGNKRNLLLASVFLILTGATHILAFGVAILFLLLYPVLSSFLGINRRSILKNAGILSLIILVFGTTVFLAFPSLFTDFYKGMAFIQDLFSDAGEASPIQFLFNPTGGAFILPVLTTGIALSYYEWRNGRKEALLAVSTVTIVGLSLSLPFIPREWLWRFLLMEFIPISFIVGHSVSKFKAKITTVVFILLCLFPLILQAVAMSETLGPTIKESDYMEMEKIGEYVPQDTVIVTDLRIGYWFQYITRSNIAKRPTPELWQNNRHVLLLIDKLSPRNPWIPPNSNKIVEEKRFALYELTPPRALN